MNCWEWFFSREASFHHFLDAIDCLLLLYVSRACRKAVIPQLKQFEAAASFRQTGIAHYLMHLNNYQWRDFPDGGQVYLHMKHWLIFLTDHCSNGHYRHLLVTCNPTAGSLCYLYGFTDVGAAVLEKVAEITKYPNQFAFRPPWRKFWVLSLQTWASWSPPRFDPAWTLETRIRNIFAQEEEMAPPNIKMFFNFSSLHFDSFLSHALEVGMHPVYRDCVTTLYIEEYISAEKIATKYFEKENSKSESPESENE